MPETCDRCSALVETYPDDFLCQDPVCPVILRIQIAALETRLAQVTRERDDCLAIEQAHLTSIDLLTDHVDAAERARAEAEGQIDAVVEALETERQIVWSQLLTHRLTMHGSVEQSVSSCKDCYNLEVRAQKLTTDPSQAARVRAERTERLEAALKTIWLMYAHEAREQTGERAADQAFWKYCQELWAKAKPQQKDDWTAFMARAALSGGTGGGV